MEVVEMAVKDLKPYENNPRVNDGAVAVTADSIAQYGFQQPIVVDKDHVIIVGHTRYKSAKKLGLEKVPVVVADQLSPTQVKAFRIADNRVGERADWDFAELKKESAEFSQDLLKNFKLDELIPQDGIKLDDFDELLENQRMTNIKYYIDVFPDNEHYDEVLAFMKSLAEETDTEAKEKVLRI